jgi:hypothetical protein
MFLGQPMFEDEILVEGLEVGPSTLSEYRWDGQEFVLSDKQTISNGYFIESQSQLQAQNRSGDIAIIDWQFNDIFNYPNDVCQLVIDEKRVGEPFGCDHDFTSVTWQDITQDDIADLVITTYSPGTPVDTEFIPLSMDRCPHQRLFAYTWEEGRATLIANIAGCVEDETLFGVRLQDFDGDGYPEIFAASNNALPRRAYKWDGNSFIFWSEIPE